MNRWLIDSKAVQYKFSDTIENTSISTITFSMNFIKSNNFNRFFTFLCNCFPLNESFDIIKGIE